MKGVVSAQKALQGSETERRELLAGTKEKSVSLMRGSLICLPGKSMIFYKKGNRKNELMGRPGDGTGRGSHWQRVVGTDSGGAASHAPCVRGGAAVVGHLMAVTKHGQQLNFPPGFKHLILGTLSPQKKDTLNRTRQTVH